MGEVKKTWKAGMISLKLSVNHINKNGHIDFMQYDSWKRLPPKRFQAYIIRAYIYQCRELLSADDNGLSDPYVELWSTDKERQITPCIEENCNPMFFSTIQVFSEFDTLETAPPIVLNVWDRDDGVLETDDFLGMAVIFIP